MDAGPGRSVLPRQSYFRHTLVILPVAPLIGDPSRRGLSQGESFRFTHRTGAKRPRSTLKPEANGT